MWFLTPGRLAFSASETRRVVRVQAYEGYETSELACGRPPRTKGLAFQQNLSIPSTPTLFHHHVKAFQASKHSQNLQTQLLHPLNKVLCAITTLHQRVSTTAHLHPSRFSSQPPSFQRASTSTIHCARTPHQLFTSSSCDERSCLTLLFLTSFHNSPPRSPLQTRLKLRYDLANTTRTFNRCCDRNVAC